ncbi:MAG TPA: adenylate/guanylate cyclase domain-containing protein, partial [Anaerolineales bacterium]|nr:adenylate/guanylate cyclase domain-containing protein [Anaerolineales bacterium]
MDERQQLEQAIAVQESLRGTIDDAIIDAAIATLNEKLADLDPRQQRKLATILFTDIVGSTRLTRGMDPEEQMALIDPLIARMAEKVDDHGGHVCRYQGDGFKAVFGLPVAQENDPQQAIRAGLAIQAEAARIAEDLEKEQGLAGFQVRVGISTGLVFSGGETEGEDTIKGEAVNLAARLESAAQPGTVLISHDSYKHVRGVFDFEPLDPIEVKEFSERVVVYRVLRAKQLSFYRGIRRVEGVETRMVGREPEFL